ncbi:protein SHQ1 homolog isoform X1 [Pleurodeles waltl]
MITPAFDLSQDPEFLTIIIKVPYARVSELDLYFEGDEFKFYAKPYFLRLNLPGRIVEDGREKASYNVDEGTFTVKLPKEAPGQHFEGLGMLTSLLAPKGSRSAKPLVEELDASADPEEEEDDFDWQIEQIPYEETCSALPSQCSYGFGNLRSGVFSRLQGELSDVIDLKSPDETPIEDRQAAQLAAEDAKFDPDHYLADLFEDEAIRSMLRYTPWWAAARTKNAAQDGRSSPDQDSQEPAVVFSDEEKQKLRNFKNKSFLLDKKARSRVYLSLVDVLLAYCYDIRVTEGERNVESSWNIRKLSGSLSWLQNYSSIHEVLVSFGRRVLCYPLYRHFLLVLEAVKDASLLLQMGKAAVLKCFLQIHRIFQENDPAYILNDLYITDYCVWIQKIKSKKLAALANCLQTAALTKADLRFELDELELAALLVQEEELEASGAGKKQSCGPSQANASGTEESSSSSSSSNDTEFDSSSGTDKDTDSSDDTEDSVSDEDGVSDGEHVKTASSRETLLEKTPPLVEVLGLIQNTDTSGSGGQQPGESLHPPPSSGDRVEELSEKLWTTVVLSEPSGDLASEVEPGLHKAVSHGAQKSHETDTGKVRCPLASPTVSGRPEGEPGDHLPATVVLPEGSKERAAEVGLPGTDAAQPPRDPGIEITDGSFQSPRISGNQTLIEELGEYLQTAAVLSECCAERATELESGWQDTETESTPDAQ